MTESKNQPGAMPDCDPNGRLSQLIRGDILRPAGAARPRALFTDQPPSPNRGCFGRRGLLEERRKGR